MITTEQWAWLAGLIDGDGCLRTESRDGATLMLRIGTRRKTTAYHLQEVYGGKINEGKSRIGRPFWTWCVGAQWLRQNLPELLPHMIEKKDQAEVALELADLRSKSRGRGGRYMPERQDELVLKLKDLKIYDDQR